MEEGEISGTIRARVGASVNLEDVTQASNDDHAVNVTSNSTLVADTSSLGRAFVDLNSSIGISSSSVKGVEIGLSSAARISDTSATADINVSSSSTLAIYNGSSLNGYNIYLCNNYDSFIDDTVTDIGNSSSTLDCL